MPKVRANQGATKPNPAKHSTGSVVSSPAVVDPMSEPAADLVEDRSDADRRRPQVERQHDQPEHEEGTLATGHEQ